MGLSLGRAPKRVPDGLAIWSAGALLAWAERLTATARNASPGASVRGCKYLLQVLASTREQAVQTLRAVNLRETRSL